MQTRDLTLASRFIRRAPRERHALLIRISTGCFADVAPDVHVAIGGPSSPRVKGQSEMRSVRKLAVVCLIGIAPVVGIAAVAGATPSPNGPGQPGTGGGTGSTSCQNFTTTPGGSASAQSPFNANGQSGQVYAGNPGTASKQHSASTHSISEYDIACFQQTTH
jgi:hypothetical protein